MDWRDSLGSRIDELEVIVEKNEVEIKRLWLVFLLSLAINLGQAVETINRSPESNVGYNNGGIAYVTRRSLIYECGRV